VDWDRLSWVSWTTEWRRYWNGLQLLQDLGLPPLELVCRVLGQVAIGAGGLATRVGCFTSRIWTLPIIYSSFFVSTVTMSARFCTL